MHALSQSPFLQALGYAIANSLWQAALLWITVILFNSIFKITATTRYKIALIAQFVVFIWFVFTLQFYYDQCISSIAQTQSGSGFDGIQNNIQSNNELNYLLINSLQKIKLLLPYLSLAYLSLLMFLASKWIYSYRFAQHIKTEGLQKADAHLKIFVQKISSLLNIKSEVKIHLSSLIKSPLTIGFLKPVILLPLASINHLSAEQMEAVILHELAHIKRADYLLNLIQSVVEITLFFNPFTQLLSKIIREERENSCDDWVLQFQYNATMYAEALLQMAYLEVQPSFAMHVAGKKGDLLFRVKRMLDKKEKTFNYRQQLIALLLMTGILTSVAWLQPSAKTIATKTPVVYKQKPIERIVKTDDNPLFDPSYFVSKSTKEKINDAMNLASQKVADAAPNIENASKEFFKVLPQAFNELKKVHFETDVKKQLDAAQDSLSQAFASMDFESKKLVDTALISASLKSAGEAISKIDFQKTIKESLLSANKEMLAMAADKRKAAKDMQLQKAMQEQDFENMQTEYKKNILKDRSKEDEKQLQLKKLNDQLQQLQQTLKNDDSANENNAYNYSNKNYKADKWAVQFPVYIENENSNADGNINSNVSFKTNFNNAQKVILIDKIKDCIIKKQIENTKSNIHILESRNGDSTEIEIEIL